MAVLSAKWVITMKQLLKEPLLHFLLTGVAIFGIYALVNPGSSSIPDKRVVVDEGRINNIIAMFEKKWNR